MLVEEIRLLKVFGYSIINLGQLWTQHMIMS